MAKYDLKGEKELLQNIEKLGTDGVQAIFNGFMITGVEILNDAKSTLDKNKQRVTGLLYNSGKVTKSQGGEQGVDISFDALYAYWVEYGRKAGKMPPIEDIKQWIRKSGALDTFSIKTHMRSNRGDEYEKQVENMAWAVAKSIAANGTKAHPFLFPAFEAKKGNVVRNIKSEYDKFIKSISLK